MLLLPFLLQRSLGGFVASSGVFLWSLTSPMGALVFQGRRSALGWLAAFLALAVVSEIIEAQVSSEAALIPEGVIVTFFVLNIGAVSAFCYFRLHYFVAERERATAALARERERSERLLLNFLPEPIAQRLREREDVIADAFPEATVLSPTSWDARRCRRGSRADQVVVLLDEVFAGSTVWPGSTAW
jgi:guanylate cyclase